jgi:nitroreductase
MDKTAPVDHEVQDLIRTRWSPRAFADRSVDEGTVRQLFEAARWAASCFNEQPWRFMVARRESESNFNRLLDCLVAKNQTWAKHAPVLMLSVASFDFAHNGKPNRHAWHDVGQAAAQLALQATSMGLAVHQMAGFDQGRARRVFEIPERYEPVAATAVGYPGEPESLPDDLRQAELSTRACKPQSEFAFVGTWDCVWPEGKDARHE